MYFSDKNLFLTPFKMPEQMLYDYTGLTTLNLWKLVDVLKKFNVKDKPRLSVVSMVVLYRLDIIFP